MYVHVYIYTSTRTIFTWITVDHGYFSNFGRSSHHKIRLGILIPASATEKRYTNYGWWWLKMIVICTEKDDTMAYTFFFDDTGWWLSLPLWKILVISQLGWWHSQLNGKIKNVPNHQPALVPELLKRKRKKPPEWIDQMKNGGSLQESLFICAEGIHHISLLPPMGNALRNTGEIVFPHRWHFPHLRVEE